MKRFVALFLALGLLCGMAFLFAPSAEAAQVIKIAGMKPEGEPETVGMHKFGEYLKQLSDGKYEVKVYPNSQLGKEDSYIDQTRRGTIQMCATGTQMSKFHPAMAMLETPMLYDDLDHAHRAMQGDTFKLITDGFDKKSGMRTMNVFPLGFRHFYTKNPVKNIDDLKGLKMRVPNIPLYTNFAKEAGISGQPMPFAEVMTSIESGAIDGGDSPLTDIASTGVYEYAPEITKTGHILVLHSLFINDKFYNNLPEQDRKWFDQAAAMAAEDVWKLMAEEDAKAEQKITTPKENGKKANISEPSTELKKYMQEAGQRSWSLFTDPNSKQYVPNAQEILDSAAKYRQAAAQ